MAAALSVAHRTATPTLGACAYSACRETRAPRPQAPKPVGGLPGWFTTGQPGRGAYLPGWHRGPAPRHQQAATATGAAGQHRAAISATTRASRLQAAS